MSAARVATESSHPELTSTDNVETFVSGDSTVAIKTRQGQTTVLQRLVGLFPITSPTSAPPHSSTTTTTFSDAGSNAKTGVRWDQSVPTSPPSRRGTTSSINVKALKIRMITWNMHDSLPKGELEELLGKVPAYTGATNALGSFPVLPADADHPYHFVVVAGQECPSTSGIPMALGAGIKQLIDRDREKEREKDKDRSDRLSPKEAAERKLERDTADALLIRLNEQQRELDEAIMRSKRSTEPAGDSPPVGWTSTVTDWLCNGGTFGVLRSKSHKTSSSLDVSMSKPSTKRAASLKEPNKIAKTGPYQLLVKERLLGIYLAIYIHRDLKPLVKGTSKSAVTAGLIGGRVGNKGGVGISINLDGTTLLFLNSHLAAHEGRVSHRLANLEKIKTELEVDDFLEDGDPRKDAEDLTDRFDFTFLCGDLNFRLDITRLHADWLISRQDYEQALTFDQLLKLMKAGTKEFAGFKEAPIDFAPTFKYDVLRTLKRAKQPDDDNNEDLDPDAENMSLSSMSTSYSRATELDLNSATALPSPSTPIFSASASKVSLGHIVSANKAKLKLLSLGSPIFKPKRKNMGDIEYYPATPNSAIHSGFSPMPVTPQTAEPSSGTEPLLVPPPKIHVESLTSNITAGSQDDVQGVEKGVYDSSHKKRVPSWCDRILWKSTAEPAPSPVVTPEIERAVFLDPPPRQPKQRLRSLLSPFRHKASKTARETRFPMLKSTADPPHLPPLKSAPPLSQIMFPSQNGLGRSDSRADSSDDHASSQLPASASPAPKKGPRRAVSTTNPNPPPSVPAHSDRPHRRSTFGVFISPLSGGDSSAPPSSRWRFLPNFLSPNSGHTIPTLDVEEPATPVATPVVIHRKGDVACLDYNTLDDRGMRRLEGRSDHRPVMGTFMAYI